MAISTYPIQLMEGSVSGDVVTFAKLCDIKDFPDLQGSPDAIETTTLSDAQQTYIKGILQQSTQEFTANYDKTVFETLLNKTGIRHYAVWFGKNGKDGRFRFTGELYAYPTGAGVNGVVEMRIGIIPASPVVKVPKAGVLTVTSEPSATESGKTKISVSPAKQAGNSYKYKTAAAVEMPLYDDLCTTGWTSWNGTAEITATTGHEIVIVEVNADNLARKVGKAIVASKDN